MGNNAGLLLFMAFGLACVGIAGALTAKQMADTRQELRRLEQVLAETKVITLVPGN